MMISIILYFLFDNFILVGTSVSVLLLYYFSTSTFDKWRKAKVPYMKPIPFGNLAKPLLGLENHAIALDKIYKPFPDEKNCGSYLMIRDPELINII